MYLKHLAPCLAPGEYSENDDRLVPHVPQIISKHLLRNPKNPSPAGVLVNPSVLICRLVSSQANPPSVISGTISSFLLTTSLLLQNFLEKLYQENPIQFVISR